MPGRTIVRGLNALKIVSFLVPTLASLLWGIVLFQNVEQAAVTHVQLQARILAQHLERVVEAQQVLHQAIVSRLSAETASFVSSRTLHLFLKDVAAAQPSMQGLQLVDAAGVVLSDSQSYPADHQTDFTEFLGPLASGEKIWIGRDVSAGHDHIVIGTPVSTQGFSGVILSKLNTSSVQVFLRRLAARQGEAASIARMDGMLLLRNFDAKPTLLPATAPGRILPMKATSGSFHAVAVTDGISRIYGFNWAENMPIFANFGEPTDLIWRDWAKQFTPLLALFCLMGVFLWVTAERIERSFALRSAQEESLKRAEQAERLAEQRINLMREMNHRVKNNLALVVSLINLQSREGKGVDPDVLKARIGAISHVHDLMHQAADAVHVDFATMLDDIASSPAIIPREHGITVETSLERGIMLGPDRITPLSVIAAELITNAVKHAFHGRDTGTIRLRLFRQDGNVVLVVSDDGVGMMQQSQRHSGNAIIEALVQQIEGQLVRDCDGGSGQSGLTTTLRFPA